MPSIRIDGWRAGLRFDAAHFIPRHPKCGRLHGHTYALHLAVHGPMDRATGFVVDFGDVKRALKAIANRLDHHVLLQTKSPELDVRRVAGGFEIQVGPKRYAFPEEDVVLLPTEHTSAEDLAEHVATELLSQVRFPPNVERVEVGVDETYGTGAWAERRLEG